MVDFKTRKKIVRQINSSFTSFDYDVEKKKYNDTGRKIVKTSGWFTPKRIVELDDTLKIEDVVEVIKDLTKKKYLKQLTDEGLYKEDDKYCIIYHWMYLGHQVKFFMFGLATDFDALSDERKEFWKSVGYNPEKRIDVGTKKISRYELVFDVTAAYVIIGRKVLMSFSYLNPMDAEKVFPSTMITKKSRDISFGRLTGELFMTFDLPVKEDKKIDWDRFVQLSRSASLLYPRIPNDFIEDRRALIASLKESDTNIFGISEECGRNENKRFCKDISGANLYAMKG